MPGPTLQSSDLTFLVWGPAIILFFKTTSLRYTLFFFLASLGLCCCEKAFSSCGAQGSLWRLLLLRNMGSRASAVIAFALRHGGSSWTRD